MSDAAFALLTCHCLSPFRYATPTPDYTLAAFRHAKPRCRVMLPLLMLLAIRAGFFALSPGFSA